MTLSPTRTRTRRPATGAGAVHGHSPPGVWSRRRVLRTGTTLGAAAATGSLAGCLGGSAPPTRVSYPLDRTDPRVRTARRAEARAYEHYGLGFAERFVDVGALGGRVRVLEVGTGPPVVVLPGGVGYGVQWLPLLPELTGYTAYVVDRPGGGLSDGIDHRALPLETIAATSTAAVYDHFGFGVAPIVGNSMGGYWGLRFALEHPARVSAVALLGCPALYPGERIPLAMRLVGLPLVDGVVVERLFQPADVRAARDGLAHLGHPAATRRRLPSALIEATYRMDHAPHYVRSMTSLVRSAGTPRQSVPDPALTPDDLRGVRPPVTLLWGSGDPYGSLEVGRAGAAHFPDAAFHEAGVGHLPWLDDPSACGDLVRAHLARAG